MAKYTTLVRTVCEESAGLSESAGFNNVDTVLANSWDNIFTTQCTFFDDTYRNVLCKKILKHYYMREIGAETVGLWKLWMNTKLEEIMPYYNQLYESALIEFNPMQNTNLSRTRNKTGTKDGEVNSLKNSSVIVDGNHDRTVSEINSLNSEGTASNSSTDSRNENNQKDVTHNYTKGDAYSDTPQSTLDNVGNLKYLTDYRKIAEIYTDGTHDVIDVDGSSSNSGEYEDTTSEAKSKLDNLDIDDTTQTSSSSNSTEEISTTEQYIESVVGNSGTWNFSRLLQDYRETFLNIDMLVVNEFKDLFMKLW